MPLAGAGPAAAAAAGPVAAAQFAVGVRRYDWTRGSRRCTTYIFYPATGTPGGTPVTNAPVANGVFPVYNFTHGLGGNPQNSTFSPALAAAGFIVPAPHFIHNLSDVNNGNTSKDVSQILTNTLALNRSGPLAGHINTGIGVGVSGHSMGGMVTHGLLVPRDRHQLGPLDHVRRHCRAGPPPRRRGRARDQVGSPGGMTGPPWCPRARPPVRP